MEKNWELYDLLLEELGAETLLENICKGASSDEMNESLEYIARCFDIEYKENEDNE